MESKKMQELLNSFWWEYREIFIEDSKWVSIVMVNWEIKKPVYSLTTWASLLSRTWKEEFFKAIAWKTKDLEEDVESFAKVELSWNNNWEKVSFEEKSLSFLSLDVIEKTDKIIAYMKDSFEKHYKDKDFLISSKVMLKFSSKNYIIGNTNNKFEKDELFYNTFYIILLWEKDWNSEEVVEKITWIDILNDFSKENIDKAFVRWLESLELQLWSDVSPSWEMDVIISSESWWTIIHEAVWHWLEADLQTSSSYAGLIWQKVADEKVTVIDDPTIKNERWFYNVDHEWNTPKKTVLIENWILKSYLHTNKTAKKFSVEPTGHARREDYRYKTLVRMWTTYLAPWKDKKEDLISKIKHWVYVSRMWWWQVNISTWDFVFEVKSWYLIENWEKTKRIKSATISWNWPEMLRNIYWVCDDLDFIDWWTCWKWQAMPVSDATATVWTKLKVSAMW